MNDNNFVKTALHYGALCGIGVFLFYMFIYAMGFSLFGSATMLGVWIPVVFIVLAVKFHRDNNMNGTLSYKQGFKMGLFTTLFSSTLFGLLFYLFGVFIATDLLGAYQMQAELSLTEGRSLMSEALYEKALDSIDEATLGSLSFSEAFNKVIGGVIISLIVAAIYKRKAVDVEIS